MLKKLSFKNFFSFREGVEIDFTLGSGVPDSVYKVDGCSTVLGIKGANGSGKTNIIKALSFLHNFCSNSYNKEADEELYVFTHFLNQDPTEFQVEFDSDEESYSYFLKVKDNEVLEESLHKVTKGKVVLFKRLFNDLEKLSDDMSILKNFKMKSNASVISMPNIINLPENLRELHLAHCFFSSIFANSSYVGYEYEVFSYEYIAKALYEDEELHDFMLEMVKKADSSIEYVEIEKTKGKDGKDTYDTFFYHSYGEEFYPINYALESSGTKRLFKDIGFYGMTLNLGGVLALDEFDTHLHPMILPEIISFFESSDKNPKKSQFIFTAHNTEIIDKLGRYRTILVNKENSESYAYRLDEISGGLLRNDRPISPTYLKGRIGGVPDV